MDHEGIMLSEISQKKKQVLYILLYTQNLKKKKGEFREKGREINIAEQEEAELTSPHKHIQNTTACENNLAEQLFHNQDCKGRSTQNLTGRKLGTPVLGAGLKISQVYQKAGRK